MKVERKRSLIISGVALALAGVVVGTFAVSQNSTVLNNVFEIANYETQFIEEFDAPSNWKTCDTVDKKIYVKNNTDVDIVARVKLDEEWNAANGMGLPLVSNGSGERMAIVNMTDNSGWTLDGTYYYSPTLAPGQTSTSVISGVTLNCDANLDVDYRYGNAEYKLSAKVETIQADRASTEWHKISVLVPFNRMIAKMYKLASPSLSMNDVHNNMAIVQLDASQLDSMGIDIADATDANIISDSSAADSNTPTYAWYYEQGNVVFWYSDADDVYLTNSTDSTMYFSSFVAVPGFKNFNASRLTNASGLFEYYGGQTLSGVEKWDMSNVTSFYDFAYRAKITDLSALSRWDVSKVQSFGYMFESNPLSDVSPLAGWNLASATTLNAAFRGTNIDSSICSLADWNISSIDEHRQGNRYFEAFYSANTNNIDATCLDAWNVEMNFEGYGGRFPGVFNNNWTKPYWAY